MKQQLITFYLDYINSGLCISEYGQQKNLTKQECKIMLTCGKALSRTNKKSL